MAYPTHRQLRTFLVTIETGSVSAAARRLHITQPAASQQLREMERALDLRLLERVGGRTVPTAAGQALLAPANRAQAALEELVSTAAAHAQGETGRVTLGTGATACIHLLPRMLTGLRRRMPGLEVIIATGNSAQICHQVETGALDLGLVTLPKRIPASLTVSEVWDDPLVGIFPGSADPGDVPDAPGPDSFVQRPLILYEPGGSTRGIIDEWFRAAGLTAQPRMQLGNIEAIKVLVAQALGASIVPRLAVGTRPATLQVRPLTPPLARRIGVVLRREKIVTRPIRLVLDALRSCAPTPPD